MRRGRERSSKVGVAVSLIAAVTILTASPAAADPVILSVSPASGHQYSDIDVTISGAGFDNSMNGYVSGPDVYLLSSQVVNSTTIAIRIEISADAVPSTRDVNVHSSSTGRTTTKKDAFTVTEAQPGQRPPIGGYVVDAWGGLHPYAPLRRDPPPSVTQASYWPGWDIARGVAQIPNTSSGYVLDAWGGLHPFTAGSDPLPPYVTDGPYWRGQDVAVGVTLLYGGGGYIVDRWGGLHPFSTEGLAPPCFGGRPPPVTDAPYWPGQDMARGVTVSGGTGGYVIDRFGALHPFTVQRGQACGSARPPDVVQRDSWPGQDVVRGINWWPIGKAGDNIGGYVLDDWGGLHPFPAAGNPVPQGTMGGPYWPGQDAARGASLDRWSVSR